MAATAIELLRCMADFHGSQGACTVHGQGAAGALVAVGRGCSGGLCMCPVVLILCGVLLVEGTWTTATPAGAATVVKQPEG